MKKLFSIMLAFVVFASLPMFTSCGDEDPIDQDSPSGGSSSQEDTKDEVYLYFSSTVYRKDSLIFKFSNPSVVKSCKVYWGEYTDVENAYAAKTASALATLNEAPMSMSADSTKYIAVIDLSTTENYYNNCFVVAQLTDGTTRYMKFKALMLIGSTSGVNFNRAYVKCGDVTSTDKGFDVRFKMANTNNMRAIYLYWGQTSRIANAISTGTITKDIKLATITNNNNYYCASLDTTGLNMKNLTYVLVSNINDTLYFAGKVKLCSGTIEGDGQLNVYCADSSMTATTFKITVYGDIPEDKRYECPNVGIVVDNYAAIKNLTNTVSKEESYCTVNTDGTFRYTTTIKRDSVDRKYWYIAGTVDLENNRFEKSLAAGKNYVQFTVPAVGK